MKEDKAKKQVLDEVDDMIELLEKQVANNQESIQKAEARIDAANDEIERSTQEIKQRIEDGRKLSEKLATWKKHKEDTAKL